MSYKRFLYFNNVSIQLIIYSHPLFYYYTILSFLFFFLFRLVVFCSNYCQECYRILSQFLHLRPESSQFYLHIPTVAKVQKSSVRHALNHFTIRNRLALLKPTIFCFAEQPHEFLPVVRTVHGKSSIYNKVFRHKNCW